MVLKMGARLREKDIAKGIGICLVAMGGPNCSDNPGVDSCSYVSSKVGCNDVGAKFP